jgi:K+-transporting ATPase ATPase C chain
MMNTLRPALVLLLSMSLLTGLIYPGAVTAIAQLLMPAQANGSLLVRDGRVIGSRLIAQPFHNAAYFHPRPSAAGSEGYDASASSGSNLGVGSRSLNEAIAQRIAAAQADAGPAPGPVPADLVTASASGLDPDLSPQAARYQLARVAAARGIDTAQLEALLRAHIQRPQWGLFGPPRVNVLELNLALDSMAPLNPAP